MNEKTRLGKILGPFQKLWNMPNRLLALVTGLLALATFAQAGTVIWTLWQNRELTRDLDKAIHLFERVADTVEERKDIADRQEKRHKKHQDDIRALEAQFQTQFGDFAGDVSRSLEKLGGHLDRLAAGKPELVWIAIGDRDGKPARGSMEWFIEDVAGLLDIDMKVANLGSESVTVSVSVSFQRRGEVYVGPCDALVPRKTIQSYGKEDFSVDVVDCFSKTTQAGSANLVVHIDA